MQVQDLRPEQVPGALHKDALVECTPVLVPELELQQLQQVWLLGLHMQSLLKLLLTIKRVSYKPLKFKISQLYRKNQNLSTTTQRAMFSWQITPW
jgi:hypothetical protein